MSKRRLIALLSAPLAIAATVGTGPARALAPGVDAPLVEIVVTVDAVGSETARRVAAMGTDVRSFTEFPVVAVRVPTTRVAEVERMTGVRAVVPNRPLRWFGGPAAPTMNAPAAWADPGVTGKGVTVAVLDSGVDGTHPDLTPALVENVKVAASTAGSLPNTDTTSGHGTHVAGIVGGRGVMSAGRYKGVAPDVDLVGIGAGEGLHITHALEGFQYALRNRTRLGIDVITNSWGGGFNFFDPSDPVNVASRAAYNAGIVVVFAQGNDSDELGMNDYAAAPWVIAAGSGTHDLQPSEFSSGGIDADVFPVGGGYGGTVTGDPRKPGRMGLYHPSVLATGSYVVSTRANNTVLPPIHAQRDAELPPGDAALYTTFSGTSMAAPAVAGTIALILEANPRLTPHQVKQVLQLSARPLDGVPFWKQGYGYSDAAAAVRLAASLAGLPPEATAATLQERQLSLDAAVLEGLSRPDMTRVESLYGSAPSTDVVYFEVDPGTDRVRLAAALSGLPYQTARLRATVFDDDGDVVGRAVGVLDELAVRGVTIDLDLHSAAVPYDELDFGGWTAEIEADAGERDTVGDAAGAPLSGCWTVCSYGYVVVSTYDND